MKYSTLTLSIVLLSLNLTSAEARVDKLLELQRTNDYQIKRFYLGRVGLDLSYIIDRSNKICYAVFLPKDRKNGQSVLEVPCSKFTAGPIKQYLDNGEVVVKGRSIIDKITGRKIKKKKN